MGFLDNRRERRREVKALRLEEQRQAEALRLRTEIDSVQDRISGYESYHDICDEFDGSLPIVPKKDEQVLVICDGVALTETRRERGTYQGGSLGTSIRVAKGASFRVGAHKGEFVPGEEKPTIIDAGGSMVVTDKRVVYVGSKHTREFRWDKLISLTPTRMSGSVLFLMPVENRQKVSGIGVGGDASHLVEERLLLGLAIHQDRLDEFLQGLRDEMALLQQELAALG